jgi:hypothetical protein
MIKVYLKAFAYGLCHCKARIGVSLNQSLGMMRGCLKFFARKLTDCFATLAMTRLIALISLVIGIMKGYLKALAYGLCHCENDLRILKIPKKGR